MLSVSQHITDTEDKEVLKKENESLHMFVSECKELLHIKKLMDSDIEKLKNEYVRQHAWMSKEELILRCDVLEDVLLFIRNYKKWEVK